MSKKPLSISLLLISLVIVASLSARTPVPPPDGEQMERQIWSDMKAKNLAAVEAKIAPAFQSVHPDGARDRAGEIALIKGLKVGPYTLKDFKVTNNGDQLIVTYSISVVETVGGKQLSTKPAMRQSVWAKNAAGWQWIAHANLNPLK